MMGELFFRPDGRSGGLQMRPVSVQLNITRKADGSAKVSHGLTCAVGLVYGPTEAPLGSLKSSSSCCFRVIMKPLSVSPLSAARAAATAAASCSAAAAVAGAPATGTSAKAAGGKSPPVNGSSNGRATWGLDCRAAGAVAAAASQTEWMRRVEGKVHALLQHLLQADAYPRCQIQVTLMLLQDDGGAEAACVNAAVAAAIDAGLPLRYRAWAVQLARLCRPHAAQQQQQLHWHHQHEQRQQQQQQQEPQAVSETELLVDLCREEEEGERRAASTNFVLEPRSGDLVCAFRSSGESSSSYTGGCCSRSTPALCEAGWAAGTAVGEERAGREETGDCCGVAAALSTSGDYFLGRVLLAALAACREIDLHARLAVEAKLQLATRTFAHNNFWWIKQQQEEDGEKAHSSSGDDEEAM